MSEWNPYKEKTEATRAVLDFIQKNLIYWTSIIISLIICITFLTAYRSYLYRTNQNIPCEQVRELMKKQGIK